MLTYAAVLDALDREHSARAHDFVQNPVEKLVQVIEANGGIIGAVKARAGAYDNDNRALVRPPIISNT